MGNDEVAKEEIAREVDIHTNTAKVFLEAGNQREFIGLSLKEARQPAKPQTFKPMYGGKGTTEAEKEYCKFFQNKYRGIADTQRSWEMRVTNDKELRTPYGLIFRWPNASVGRWGDLNVRTNVYNYPVQGFATGEIIPLALVLFWQLCRDRDVHVINTIHDSIIARVHKDSVEWYKETVRLCLTTYVFLFLKEFYRYEFRTYLGCGIKISRNWGDTNKEVTYNVSPDGSYTEKTKE